MDKYNIDAQIESNLVEGASKLPEQGEIALRVISNGIRVLCYFALYCVSNSLWFSASR
jgi:hypothetical protein